MAAMFTMMNTERLSVGIQGLGIGEAACQAAVWYARERFRADPRRAAASRQARRPDHRAPRCAADVDDDARV
jgi:alkylation response protein AidB-like acyl-CoA dehydrogenase